MSKKDIRAVFVDLDGTLLHGVKIVSDRTVDAFRRIKEKGVVPVVCTGRLAYESDFAIRAIDAMDFVVAINGLEVYDDYHTKHLLYERALSKRACIEIAEHLMKYDVWFQIYAGDRAYCPTDRAKKIYDCGMDYEHAEFFDPLQVLVDDLVQFVKETDIKINKFLVSTQDTEQTKRIRAELDAMEGVHTVQSSWHFTEVIPEGADKRHAVRLVRETLGLDKDEIMVIGDSENDRGMFDEAGLCIAVGNAIQMLKDAADVIAPTNDEDGVAWALEKYILNDE